MEVHPDFTKVFFQATSLEPGLGSPAGRCEHKGSSPVTSLRAGARGSRVKAARVGFYPNFAEHLSKQYRQAMMTAEEEKSSFSKTRRKSCTSAMAYKES